MASLALISADVGHNAATAPRTALIAAGHTVTLVAEANVGTHDFSSYDAVLTSRPSNANRASVASVLEALNDLGMPLVVCPLESEVPAGTGIETHVTLLGLAGTFEFASGLTQLHLLSGAHPTTRPLPSGDQTLFSGNWVSAVDAGQDHLGTATMLGPTGSAISGQVTGCVVPAGTARQTSGTTGARVVVFPIYLLTGAYSPDHALLLSQAVEWAITGDVALHYDLLVSKLGAYAVTGVEDDKSSVAKLTGYAVMATADDKSSVAKLTGYAVMGDIGANVTISKLVGYAVMGTFPAPGFVVGVTLGYDPGTFDPEATSYLQQWLRDANPIDGATAATYTLAEADIGALIALTLIPVNSNGPGPVVQLDPVGPVQPA